MKQNIMAYLYTLLVFLHAYIQQIKCIHTQKDKKNCSVADYEAISWCFKMSP